MGQGESTGRSFTKRVQVPVGSQAKSSGTSEVICHPYPPRETDPGQVGRHKRGGQLPRGQVGQHKPCVPLWPKGPVRGRKSFRGKRVFLDSAGDGDSGNIIFNLQKFDRRFLWPPFWRGVSFPGGGQVPGGAGTTADAPPRVCKEKVTNGAGWNARLIP